jgi:superfamily II DNA or RNA helicase
MIEITERFLSDAGGWQALKQARALHEMGRVIAATYEPPLLQGRVREGDTELRSGLKILSKSNVENLCSCRASRRDGTICAHSLAVGLAILKPRAIAPQSAPALVSKASTATKTGPVFSTSDGEPLALFLVLPPNFAAAWERDNVTLGVEAEVAGKRKLLSALDAAGHFRCAAADEAIIEKLRAINDGALPGMLTLRRDAFAGILPLLAEHAGVTFGKSARAEIRTTPSRPPLEMNRESDGSMRLAVKLPEGSSALISEIGAWLLNRGVFQPLAPGLPRAYHDLLRREIVLPPEQADAFMAHELANLASAFELDRPTGMPTIARVAENPPEAPGFALALEGSLNHLTARLDAVYKDRTCTVEAGRRPESRRDESAELHAIERLASAGFTGPDGQGQWVLKGEPRILAFFARDLPRMERDWKVTVGSRFEHVTRDIERIQPRIDVQRSGENWFDLQFDLSTASGEHFSAAEIQRLLNSGQNSTRQKNRKLAVFDPAMLDEFQQVLTDCNPQQRQPGLYRMERRHAGYIDGVAKEQGTAVNGDATWRDWAAPGAISAETAPPKLGALTEVLRPYQVEGVMWLMRLSSSGLGGILADEMGLGKTVQTLAFLRCARGKSLVVCPSSLVFNWQREAERFTPELRVLAIHGPDRAAQFGRIGEADLIITSYALLRRDLAHYKDVAFTAAILDEAQHIKNPASQNAQSACALKASHRIALTGTPVENSLGDIWSLMNFLMPGYLGSREDFRDRFERAIQSDPGGPVQRRLAKRIQPFVLRRLKRNVIKELPDKIEQVSYCELTAIQQQLYNQLTEATRRQVAELASDTNAGKTRMLMLTALLRLRQACCDPRLLGPGDPEKPLVTSAKVELLEELLQEAIDGGHRVLVFSQFVAMLQILRERLEALDIPFCYLDGATKDRASVVDRFQAGETPVFLISLKAGGVGLNLTAADTVVHFDPWWNPAVENQATDRAHRIGQKNVVTSYKLIARGTIEEKILALQQRKRALIDATVDSEQPMMEGLAMEEIKELLT